MFILPSRYEEFLKLHPDYKSSKKNLWRKYKWYKSRMSQVEKDNHENMSDTESSQKEVKMETGMEVEVEQQHQPLKLKNIRKDVFHYLKAVMEESRIFLPMKLPEEQEILPQPTPQMPEVVHVEVPEVS